MLFRILFLLFCLTVSLPDFTCGRKRVEELKAVTPTPEDKAESRSIQRHTSPKGEKLSCDNVDSDDVNSIHNGMTDPNLRWTDYTIYVDPIYTQEQYTLINNALYRLHQTFSDCLNFWIYPYGSAQPSSGDYIHVRNGTGCSAAVGRKGGSQSMTLKTNGCMSIGTILHEMTHALGLQHEQSRKDRDTYVTIQWKNIIPGKEFNFYTVNETSTYGVAYNLKSLMHYFNTAFSKNGEPTIVAKNGGKMGSTGELQQTDIDKIRKMYNC